jgi:hypothetical protein
VSPAATIPLPKWCATKGAILITRTEACGSSTLSGPRR